MNPNKENTTRFYTYRTPNGKIRTVVRNYERISRNSELPEFSIDPRLRRKDIHEQLSNYMLVNKDRLKNSTYMQITAHVNKDFHVMSQYNIAKLWNKIIGPRNTKKKTEDVQQTNNEQGDIITYGKQ